MKLIFSNTIFEVEDLLTGKINQKHLIEQEKYILNFIKQWQAGQATYPFLTSGSTGTPKSITLSKEQLSYSAQQTINYLFKKKSQKSFLHCIDPKFIGGTQVITRAILANADLIIKAPSSNPLSQLNQEIDLASLVPLQVETILNKSSEKFSLLKNVLIGGAELKPDLIQRLGNIQTTRFFQTYGMTETASHIAIKLIAKDNYSTLGDVQIDLDIRNCLRIKGTVTNHKWIQTNDNVKITEGGFKWLGRADWVINSGGLKIFPENIERKINAQWPSLTVAISSVPDALLGERVVLISSRPILEKIKSAAIFSKHELPKEEHILLDWPTNEGGKMDRKKIQDWVRNTQGNHSSNPPIS